MLIPCFLAWWNFSQQPQKANFFCEYDKRLLAPTVQKVGTSSAQKFKRRHAGTQKKIIIFLKGGGASFLLLLEDLEGVFLASGGGIRILARGAAVLLQRALLGRQLRDAGGGALGPGGRGGLRLGGTERAGGLGGAVGLARRRPLLLLLLLLRPAHEDGAVGQMLAAALVEPGAAVGQAVQQRDGLHQEAFGGKRREGQRRVRVGAIQVPAEGNATSDRSKVSGSERSRRCGSGRDAKRVSFQAKGETVRSKSHVKRMQNPLGSHFSECSGTP